MLLVLAAAAAGLLYWATDGFRLKAAIAGRLQDALGKKVRINGGLALKLQIPLTVSLQDLQIQNASWGSAPAMAQIAQLEAQIGIASLLRGNIRIPELQLTGTDFFLERSKAGVWNFEIQRAQAPAATDAVGRIRLNDSRLVYWRAEDKRRFQIEIVRLAADIGRAHAPAAVSADLVYQKVPFAVDGSLQPAGAAWDAADSIAMHMQVSSGSSSLTVDGSINLKTERLNISLKPIEKGGIGFGGGKVDLGLGGIADLFKLGGTLAHPSLAVDKSETAISAAVTLGKAIGGTLLFGPVGLAAALVDADFDADNPCISALKEAGAAPAAGSDAEGRAEMQSE
jgi:uncharacterized protein involved in outer membrane biogenesis